ncbi:hypothetical protein SODALDRAFT_98294 [Sodiomyces alkalinus F11]|uniref:Uncharacterized protein n=1 Tax=Sodiomyces alkalinus (strain CBS 110278 / VKM F-3762 / F11) TaxID=1314773 RepID=A0A3N2Q188_SODAK|nr:hypothetical protein SODALDRAFT_98294 [Sodiomyces alkalinus F11]ROT40521.1 hypothetical protein SODALDRAFT_98294 [Sodiomyces alkalinus F11]
MSTSTYLCHGFRWHRPNIHVFAHEQDIGDAALDSTVAPESSAAIIRSFYTAFDFLPHRPLAAQGTEPATTSSLPGHGAVKLLEEHDCRDSMNVGRPYAFVADHAVRVHLSVSVVEEMALYEACMSDKAAVETSRGEDVGWFEKLRDKLQPDEDIRWYVIVCREEEGKLREDRGFGDAQGDGGVKRGDLSVESPPDHTPEETGRKVSRGQPEADQTQMQAEKGDGQDAVGETTSTQPKSGTAAEDAGRQVRPARERSMSASRPSAGGCSYSPFPRPVLPPTITPRPATRNGNLLKPYPEIGSISITPAPPPPANFAHKSRSLRRLFGRKKTSGKIDMSAEPLSRWRTGNYGLLWSAEVEYSERQASVL